MSIARCNYCEEFIDTDEEEFVVVDELLIKCQICIEDEDEVESRS